MTSNIQPDGTPMTAKPRTWISLWFLITAPVVAWDAGYCFMRPRSMPGGDLHWIWKPYGIYMNIDYIYGLPALLERNGFTNAQAMMNVVETLLNILYLYLAHVAKWPPAPIIGFASAALTLGKTALYWLQEYYCGYCDIGHNAFWDLILLWVIPNGLWLVVPTLIVLQLGKDLAHQFSLAAESLSESKKTK